MMFQWKGLSKYSTQNPGWWTWFVFKLMKYVDVTHLLFGMQMDSVALPMKYDAYDSLGLTNFHSNLS